MRFYFPLVMMLACSQVNDGTKLKRATEIHKDALSIGHSTALMVSKLKQEENGFSNAQRDSLKIIMHERTAWYDEILEGTDFTNEVDQHDHQEHRHDHVYFHHENIPVDQILQSQLALRTQIEKLQIKVLTFGTYDPDKENNLSAKQPE
jgi:hypothetical protein